MLRYPRATPMNLVLRRSFTLLAATLALGAMTACPGPADTSGAGAGAGTGSGAGPTGEGLPCDVVDVLSASCWSCHGATLAGNAPMRLTTYAELTAPAASDASKSLAQVSVERMKSAASPMPPAPAPAVDAAGIAAFEAWVAAGTPQGDCQGGAGGDPFGGGVLCSSGKTWTLGSDTTDALRHQMYPGQACNACHSTDPEQPPIFSVAGTVHPTGHEPDDCYGVDGNALTDVKVVITDANGGAHTLDVNATGNFSSELPIAKPYTAKVVSSKGERAMVTAQTDGDCNVCHTEQGTGPTPENTAPGRIVVPW